MNLIKSKSFPDIETDRLHLRRPSIKDSSQYHRILSCPEISRYSDVPNNPSEKHSKQFVHWMSKLYSRGTGVAWIIELKQNNTLVGAIRVYNVEKKARCGMVGYEVHPEKWNSGIATEALAAVVSHSHKELMLNRLEAWTSEGNVASEQVLLKNRFQFEGIQREKAWIRDQYWHVRLYAHLASDDQIAPPVC